MARGLDADQILTLIQGELRDAETPDVDEALDYFDNLLPGPPEADEGEEEWTHIPSGDVRNAVLGTLAEIMPGFFQDRPAQFLPMNEHDEDQADQESQVVHWVLHNVCNGYEALMRSIQDGLVNRSAIVRVAWSERIEMQGQRAEGVNPMVYTMLLQQQEADQGAIPSAPRVVGGEEAPDGSLTLDLAIPTYVSEPLVEWVPREEMRIASGWSKVDLDACPFVARVTEVMASDLVAMGLDPGLVDQLEGQDDTEDRARRMVTVAECYAMLDVDGDGLVERRRVITGGGPDGDQLLLDDRPVMDQPFAFGVAFFSMRDADGISLFDRLKSIQDVNTALMTQLVEAGWRNLLQRLWAVERQVDRDQLAASRRGGIVDVKSPDAVGGLADVPVGQAQLMVLDRLDKLRRESGGGPIDTATQAQQIGGDSAHGIERIMTAIEQGTALAARNLAETLVTQVYLKLHALLRRHWRGVINARAGNTWLQALPETWHQRKGVAVAVGLSVGDRMRQAQNLAQVMAAQTKDMEMGLGNVLVTPSKMYQGRMDFARLMGIHAPAQYWLDPDSPEGMEKQQQKQQEAQQMQQLQQQAQMAQGQLMQQIETIRAEVDRYKADLQHVQKINDQLLKQLELSARFNAEDVADVAAFNVRGSQNGQENRPGRPVRGA